MTKYSSVFCLKIKKMQEKFGDIKKFCVSLHPKIHKDCAERTVWDNFFINKLKEKENEKDFDDNGSCFRSTEHERTGLCWW